MLSQRLMWIVWPAFLVAGVLEMLVFAVVDPSDLTWLGHPLGLSRQAVYTMAFFVFWGCVMVASGLTTLLARSPLEVNRCPLPAQGRSDACAKQEAVSH